MRQAFHIFKKDVRYLWLEIAVTLALVAAFTFTGARRAEWLNDPGVNRNVAWLLEMWLLPIAGWALIVRVIQAEAIPGDRQFWITRPYAWQSLLGAKALFILMFVNLPMLLADAVMIRAYGFRIGAELPGLLWTQVLLTAALVLPTAALSAMTTGFLQLLSACLILLAGAVGLSIVSPDAGLNSAWGPLDWVKSSYSLGVITLASLAILGWQYARRRTAASRILAAAALLMVLLGTALMPWTAAFAIQTLRSKQRVDESSMQVGFDEGRKFAARALVDRGNSVRIEIPLRIMGVPDGMSAKPEGVIAAIEAPGASWRADQQPWMQVTATEQAPTLVMLADSSFYGRVKDNPAKLHGSLYLTLYGNRRTATLPFYDRSVPVPGVGLCAASKTPDGGNYFLQCSSAFRSQPNRVSIHFLQSGKTDRESSSYSSRQTISYAPFPASLSIDPVSQYFVYSTSRKTLTAVSVDVVEPMAYIKRDFEIKDLRLSDYEVRR